MSAEKPGHRKHASSIWHQQRPLQSRVFTNFHKGERVIKPNCDASTKRAELYNSLKYKNNAIFTTKYSWWTFFPHNFMNQISTKYATIYFIFIAILNVCPVYKTVEIFLGFLPPAIVIFATMVKDALEDIKRWLSDNEINQRKCYVWDAERKGPDGRLEPRYRKTLWKNPIVGDLVKVFNNQNIPADLVLLRSSNRNGACFVQTSNLDGETTLKQRCVTDKWRSRSNHDLPINPSLFKVHCGEPDKDIDTINATFNYNDGSKEPITKHNVLLRGSKLKNTAFVEGIVLYAGHDTKVMMNNGRAPLKISDIERKTNYFILICLIILVAMVIIGCALYGVFLAKYEKNPFAIFIPWDSPSPGKGSAIAIGIFLISYQVMVPISLYVTMEFVKLLQVFFIHGDIEMYDEETDFAVKCNTWNISEELGQITHILSDKTGTLTQNNMVFRNCALDEEDYSCDPENSTPEAPLISTTLKNRCTNYKNDDPVSHFFRNILVNNTVVVNKGLELEAIAEEQDLQSPLQSPTECPQELNAAGLFQQQVSVVIQNTDGENIFYEDVQILKDQKKDTVFERLQRQLRESCHSVSERVTRLIPPGNIFSQGADKYTDDDEDDEVEKVKFHAESPDELALVKGAELYGFFMVDRTATGVTLRYPDSTTSDIDVKLVFPFDSERKMMSVVVEDGEKLVLYIKGADSAVLKRISNSCEELKTKLNSKVYQYSCRGLRTLCFAMKEMSKEEFTRIEASYNQLMMIRADDRGEMLNELRNEVETEMTIIGVTGIEDKLQEEVSTTIKSLKGAGIQVWILTGDKLETAENIARSSGLFDDETGIFRVNDNSDVIRIDEDKYNIVLSTKVLPLLQDGNPLLIKMLTSATCVLCYRMTPAHKACVAHAVKKYLKGNVLCIGDGANDVPMIQAANVGIGVKGKEGMQATMASDFAIGKFRFLRKLILVHGHWSYYRLALSFLYFLYKNMNLCFILFFYQFYCGDSGTYFMDSTYSVLYPIIFTSVQPVIVGVLDQDSEAKDLLEKPKLYSTGRFGQLYTFRLFFICVLESVWQAAVIYFVPQCALWESDAARWTFGFYVATGMMFVNNGHLALEVRYWHIWIGASFGICIGLHFSYFLSFYDFVPTGYGNIVDLPTEVALNAVESASFWYAMLITVVLSLIPRFFIRVADNSDLFSAQK